MCIRDRLGVRLATAQTMAGAAEVLAYGTAVRLKRASSTP